MPSFGQIVTQAATNTAAPTTPQGVAREKMRSQTLNDPSLMGNAASPTPQRATQVGSSIPVASLNQGGVNIPSFLSNPAAVLGNAMNPYANILSQIFGQPQPQPTATAIPQNVADAYSAAANAAAARQNAQAQAINVALSLPSTAINLGQREASMAPMSLAGLPTGLGYRDPLQSLRDRIFQTNAAMLPNSGINQLARASAGASGWAPSLPMF